jgi:hypothetical protein
MNPCSTTYRTIAFSAALRLTKYISLSGDSRPSRLST